MNKYGLSLTTVPKDLYYVEHKLVADQAAEIERLREEARDARDTLSAWFDLSEKAETEIEPVLMDCLKTYLQRSRNGGMPEDKANIAETVLSDMIRLYAGKALVPVLRGIVAHQQTPKQEG